MQILAGLTGLRNKQTTNKRPDEKSRYRGVEIIAHPTICCDAVRDIRGKRFLSKEVPKLPLAGCDAGDCKCTYELFEDRRTDVRRASDVAFDMRSRVCSSENRGSSGRRKDD